MPDLPILELPIYPNPAILFHPSIPRDLWGVNPRNLFGKENWDEQRKRCYLHIKRCMACGFSPSKYKLPHRYGIQSLQEQHKHNKDWLEAHEIFRYNYLNSTATFVGMASLCHLCHNYIHRERVRAIEEKKKRKTKTKYYQAVFNHGPLILSSVLPEHRLHSNLIRMVKLIAQENNLDLSNWFYNDKLTLSQENLLSHLPYGDAISVHGRLLPLQLSNQWTVDICGTTYKKLD